MMMLYSTFTLIAIISSSTILSGYLSKHLESEIYRANIGLLSQIQIFCDTYLINKVAYIVAENLSITSTGKVTNFINSSVPDNPFFHYQILQDMKDYVVYNNDFIDSIYVYRKRDDTLISTREGLVYSVTSQALMVNGLASSKNTSKGIVNIDIIKRSGCIHR